VGGKVVELLGIDPGKEAAEGVVGGDAVWQFQEAFKPVKLDGLVKSQMAIFITPGMK